MKVDFGKTVGDYGRFRAGFPSEFFARIAALDLVRPGTNMLDLGTGTGTIALNLARRGARVTALDPSAEMIGATASQARDEKLEIEAIIGKAEETGLPAASFDLVIAGQCWHWFDRPRAAAEARRVLVPGGRLMMAHFDWVSLPGNVVAATEDLIVRHNPSWTMRGQVCPYLPWYGDLYIAGFVGIETFSFDLDVPYSHEAWRGRIRASAGIAASLPPDDAAAFDAEHAALLARDFPAEPMHVPHRCWAVWGRKK